MVVVIPFLLVFIFKEASSLVAVSPRRFEFKLRATDSDEDMQAAFRRRLSVASVEEAKQLEIQAEIEMARVRRRGELGMRDKRVQAEQEPQNELRELTEDPGNWGLLGPVGMVARLSLVLVFFAGLTLLFVDNYDTYNELVDLSLAQRTTLSCLFGGVFASISATRLLGQWTYVADRLSDRKLYFEETGWADGFSLTKPDQTAFRDKMLYDDEVAPRLVTIRRAVSIVYGSTALSTALFYVVWSP